MLGLAFILSGCSEPAPTELPTDGASLTAAPNKATPYEAFIDVRGPIPGLPNIINWDCVSIDPTTGVTYFDKCIERGTVTGDLDSTAEVVITGRQDAAGNLKNAHGHFVLDVCHAELGCGTFEGPLAGDLIARRGFLEARGHGTGDFHTMQLRGTAAETTPDSEIFEVTGVIF